MQRWMSVGAFAAPLVALLIAAAPVFGADAPAAAAPRPRVVNITSDSPPGWTPSVEMERAAYAALHDYLSDKDAGRYARAYAALSPGNRRDQSLDAWSAQARRFNDAAGAVTSRLVVQLTWTKDPPHGAPEAGVYAAFDLASKFANVAHHCGYIVMHQPSAGGAWVVMREEQNFIDNATYASAGGAAAWATLSHSCPNYPGDDTPQPPLPEADHSTIGYPNVAAALAALKVKPGVTFNTVNGWTVATDEPEMTIWSFAPPGSPPYPAVVKRQVKDAPGGGAAMEMTVQCEASKAACDDLVRTFQAMNAQAMGR